MHTTNARNVVGTNLGDDTFSGFKVLFGHADIIREYRDKCQRNFAKNAMEKFAILAMMQS